MNSLDSLNRNQNNQVVVTSRMEERLPDEIVRNIGSFLSYEDQGRFVQVARFTRGTVVDYKSAMIQLKNEVEQLPDGGIACEESRRLFTQLVASPAVGHPEYWMPVMRAWIGYHGGGAEAIAKEAEAIAVFIQIHAELAKWWATSTQPNLPDAIYRFCRFLNKRGSCKTPPSSGL